VAIDRDTARRWLTLGRRLVALVRTEQVTFLAAGIAYYAFVSVLPLLLLVLSLGSLLGGESMAERVVTATGRVLSPVGQDLLREALVSAGGRAPATLLSVALLGWSTLKVFRGLDIAFSRIYGTEVASGPLGKARDAAVALGAVGGAVGVLVVGGVLLSRAGIALTGALGTVALAAALSVVFLPLYYLLPSRRLPLRAVVPGTVLAGVGWTLLGMLFGFYATVAGGTSLYGALGAVLLLVTWFYVGSIVLLAGATLNAVLAGVATETGNDKRPASDTTPNERL
jgi:YihY family inner membrane protein